MRPSKRCNRRAGGRASCFHQVAPRPVRFPVPIVRIVCGLRLEMLNIPQHSVFACLGLAGGQV